MDDPQCDGFTYVPEFACHLQYGGDDVAVRGFKKALNLLDDDRLVNDDKKARCYEKTLSELSIDQICWQANNLGLCDKAYDANGEQGPSLTECESDLGEGEGKMGTKFCKILTKMMNTAGRSFKEGVTKQLSMKSSFTTICGASCPGTTWTVHEGKICKAPGLRLQPRERVRNFSICLAKCAADVACKGVHRRYQWCYYQSRVDTKDIKNGVFETDDDGNATWNSEFCYVKN